MTMRMTMNKVVGGFSLIVGVIVWRNRSDSHRLREAVARQKLTDMEKRDRVRNGATSQQ